MSSVMPTVSETSPSLHRVGSSDSLKNQVVKLQDRTVAASSVTPVKLQRPVPTSERRDRDLPSPGRDGDGKSSRKRANMSDVPSPSSPKRHSSDNLGFSVVLEGELSVVEQIEHGDAPSVRRSLGKINCRLTRQGRRWALEIDSEDSSSPLRLPLATMKLVYDYHVPSHSFTLRGVNEGATRVKSFSFTASASDERGRWVKELREHVAEASADQNTPSSTTGTPPLDRAADARRQLREEMAVVTNRPVQRPVKRGGLVYTVPPKMTHIILVRHGHYINAHAKNISDSDQVLSQMGRKQAELTGKYLDKLYHRCPARNQQVALYHSDLTRAVETATVMAKTFKSSSLTPEPSSLLREGWPGQPFATDQMPPHMLKENVEDEELDRMDRERMEEAYNKFFAENSDEDECLFRIIVCHANLIRYFLCRTLRIDPHGVWGHFEINHCGVTRIDMCRNRPIKVLAINETGHLPHSLTTSSEDHL